MNDLLAIALAGASATCLVGAVWGPLVGELTLHESACLGCVAVLCFFQSMERWVW